MKSLILTFILLFSPSAFAAESSESSFNSSDASFHGAVGFTGGGFSIGGEYERRIERTYGFGGYLRLLAKDDDNGSHGVKALGAFIRPHFHRRAWDLFVTAGFGIHAVDSAVQNVDDETALGAAFGLGLYYQYTEKMAFGMEQFSLYGWFADDHRGMIEDTAMFKIRYQL